MCIGYGLWVCGCVLWAGRVQGVVQETVDKKPSPRESILLHFVLAYFFGKRDERGEGRGKGRWR